MVLFGLGVNIILQEYEKAQNVETISSIIEQSDVITKLIHELQKERDIATGYISSTGDQFAEEMIVSRRSTDEAYKKLLSILGQFEAQIGVEEFSKSFKIVKAELKKLKGNRKKIDYFSFRIDQILTYYSSLINHMLNLIESPTQFANDGIIIRRLRAFTAFQRGIEYAGLERAYGTTGFGFGRFIRNIHRNFIQLGAQQEVFFKNTRRYSSPENAKALKKLLTSKLEEEVVRYRDKAESSPFGYVITDVSAEKWFAKSSERINKLAELEDAFQKDVLDTANAIKSSAYTKFFNLGLGLTGLLIFMAYLSLKIAGSITGPIKRLTNVMGKLADGHNEVEILEHNRTDEIGRMAKAVVIFKENAIERLRLEAVQNKEREARTERQKCVEELITEFREQSRRSLSSVASLADQLRGSANVLDTTAQSTLDRSTTVKSASELASANVEAVACATEQMSASIREIATQIHNANELIETAAGEAQETNKMITSLSGATEKIGDVIKLIQDIAEQTNLLALNATIEAARAGESGKGFAVVAAEVKELASQTAKATEEISAHITGIQEETNGTVEVIDATAKKMLEVNQYTSAIATAVEEQGSATDDIANNILNAAGETREVQDNVSEVHNAANDTSRSASDVLQASEKVEGEAYELREIVDRFLEKVAAA